MPNNQYSQSQLDALARSRGFPDYKTWVAWNSHRNAALKQPQGYSVSAPQQAQQQPLNLSNWFQMLKRDPAQAFARLMPQSSGIMKAADALDAANRR